MLWKECCNLAPRAHRKGDKQMFLALFAVLVVLWLMGFLAFHVAGGLIHLLLIFAVISLVLHFVRGSRTA